jgi:hypothetical protein
VSKRVSVQALEHSVRFAPHEATHEPLEQTIPEGHTVLHAPQFLWSLARSMQPPLQSVSPD